MRIIKQSTNPKLSEMLELVNRDIQKVIPHAEKVSRVIKVINVFHMLRKLVETWKIAGERLKYKTSTSGKMEMYFSLFLLLCPTKNPGNDIHTTNNMILKGGV